MASTEQPSASVLDSKQQADLNRRLGRLQGQLRGICRMTEDGRSCCEILQQVAAVRAAIASAAALIVSAYLQSGQLPDSAPPLQDIADIGSKFMGG